MYKINEHMEQKGLIIYYYKIVNEYRVHKHKFRIIVYLMGHITLSY